MEQGPCRVVPITERAAGRRLDVFLALRFSDWSRAAFARHIRAGLILSDQRTLKPSTMLRVGEVLRIYVPGIAPIEAAPPFPPVLFEDDHILAVDKPAGLLTHSAGQRWSYGVVGLARGARPDAEMMDLAHRIDRETSGVLLLTKTVAANRRMKDVFQNRVVSKSYLALVRGVPTWDDTSCDVSLGRAIGSEVMIRRGPNPEGEAASTRFEVVQRLAAHTLVSCKPVTGRTHQIRAHLEILGFPILGDKLYGQPDDVFIEHLHDGPSPRVREAIGFPRHCLHARTLYFPHPLSGHMLRLHAPLPPDMQAVVDGASPSWPEAAAVEPIAPPEEAEKPEEGE